MELTELENIFEVSYGNKFDANKMKFIKDGKINFISRDSKNNGCIGTVEKYKETNPFESGLITVTLGGSYVLSSFIQPKMFYTAQNICVLKPRKELSEVEKLYYCKCISMNRFKYSAFGREANKTIKKLKVPKHIPNFVYNTKIKNLQNAKQSLVSENITLNTKNWEKIKLKKIFDVVGSKSTSKKFLKKQGLGKYPYITTKSGNNGVDGFYNFYTEEGNILVIDSAVAGHCSYQSENFSASDHVEKLLPKFELNKFIALFLVKLINMEKYKYSYGRKCNQERIKETQIKLPFKNNEPDWEFVDKYMKSLKFSSVL